MNIKRPNADVVLALSLTYRPAAEIALVFDCKSRLGTSSQRNVNFGTGTVRLLRLIQSRF